MAATITMASSSLQAAANNNEEYNLILSQGRGAKRKYNKKHARLVSPRVNNGGWVTVQS